VRGNAQVRRRMPSWWQRRRVNVPRQLTSMRALLRASDVSLQGRMRGVARACVGGCVCARRAAQPLPLP
jgi:hypothetical protein